MEVQLGGGHNLGGVFQGRWPQSAGVFRGRLHCILVEIIQLTCTIRHPICDGE